ncbi:MAG: ETC complex I subunit, partial [Rhodobacteraceae bacterium]|nr:ETC complex I subunit [Paracoccaceae bacterium]
MRARIYKPAKTAMSSGTAKTRNWVLEYAQGSSREIDPLMGWTSTSETQTQVKLRFESKDAAINYANEKGIEFEVTEPKPRKAN